MKEPILEPFLRRLRLNTVLPYLSAYPNCDLLDIGCGWEAKLLREVEPYLRYGVGIDLKAPLMRTDKISTMPMSLSNKLPFKDNSFDLITMLAVLEHLESEDAIIRECSRLLRPGGGLLITVPTWHAKPVLEFLSFRLNLVNRHEILDHKRYYNRYDLIQLFNTYNEKLEIKTHRYFQFGFNNLIFLIRRGIPPG